MEVVGGLLLKRLPMIPRDPRASVAIVADKRPTPTVGATVWVGAVKEMAVKEDDIARLRWRWDGRFMSFDDSGERIDPVIKMAHIFYGFQIRKYPCCMDEIAPVRVWIDGFVVRAGNNPQTAGFDVSDIQRQPRANQCIGISRDIVRILMPALST
jgi:hypothetical protein